MKIDKMENHRQYLEHQYDVPLWTQNGTKTPDELREMVNSLEKEYDGASKMIIKAKTFELLMNNAAVAVDTEDIFQDKINARRIMIEQRVRWQHAVEATLGEDMTLRNDAAATKSFTANPDFGHLSVNTKKLLELGLDGLMNEIKAAEKALTNPTKSNTDFYESVRITLGAFKTAILRLSDACESSNPDCADCLRNISSDAPKSLYEALQLIVIHFHLHEFIMGSRVRTLGRLDDMLIGYYRRDIELGRYTKEELKEIIKYFLLKLWAMKVPYDLPFELGGMSKDGSEITNELSYVIVEAYMELDIYSPKIHIRVSDNTPKDFVLLVLSSIRAGKSSFVFANDNVVIKSLEKVGISTEDARDYTFIGCYEPAVYGHEIGCTGNGTVNGAKMLEFVMTRGYDLKTGKKLGIDTGSITSFDELMAAVKAQMSAAVDHCTRIICAYEKNYMEIFPDAMLSSMLEECIACGRDAFDGGARYNNSSLNFLHIATLTDSLAVMKKLVFDKKLVTFDELCYILKNNWQGHETLRAAALRLSDKYGNGSDLANSIAKEIASYYSAILNNRPNGRGGVFKASFFTIDHFVENGKETMATPDGRHAGDILSKNLSSTNGMDKNGITTLIDSVCCMDMTGFPNGTVLDIILHPSAVSGDDGLEAMYGLLMTYFSKGGFALHGNVFGADTLKKAQKDPEKYATLQVRVCGWNAYFVNLSPEEQNDFIKKAESV